MALEGTLKDFALPDILQLIGLQKKTGTLLLRDETDEVTITFKDGSLVSADSDELSEPGLPAGAASAGRRAADRLLRVVPTVARHRRSARGFRAAGRIRNRGRAPGLRG